MTVTIETKVGQIAAEHPLATRVFARHGIDYCCGGGRPLREACREKGVDAVRVIDEIRNEIREEAPAPGAPSDRWHEAPLGELVDHILARYHGPLHEELPRLEAMARKVVAVHRDRDPERLPELLSTYLQLKAELDGHMAKEEQILFPMIQRGQGRLAGGPVAVMEHEHDVAGSLLRRLRELTGDYDVPAEACNTWRALWHGLKALEEDMHDHIHLENNILFPRALA
ncbi:MAG TPA: iron-sulfur cluster repair di-iron protein [Planctomycetota bacterium]|nr:iron-sulfur cluster repair di-iron protein [Planctomycetota bacterium]